MAGGKVKLEVSGQKLDSFCILLPLDNISVEVLNLGGYPPPPNLKSHISDRFFCSESQLSQIFTWDMSIFIVELVEVSPPPLPPQVYIFSVPLDYITSSVL